MTGDVGAYKGNGCSGRGERARTDGTYLIPEAHLHWSIHDRRIRDAASALVGCSLVLADTTGCEGVAGQPSAVAGTVAP